ncbi:MAG: glycosyltransferase [Fibromonadaceae bacterium]|jgi:glycosyltransferase involved in cell wall biosynthesis|nr:glycosyltransferase [Fibromonadaceae bacterium]
MNILYVLKSFPAGSGIDSVTRILGNEFVKLGHDVFVCCFLYSKKTALVDSKIKVYEFPDKWELADSKNNISFLNQIIKEYSIDIVINQEADVVNVCSLCSKAKKDSKAKLISCLHFSLFMNMESKGSIIARLLPKKIVKMRRIRIQLKRRNFAYDNSDMFVMLSDKYAEQYKKYMPNNLSKLRSISNPINYETQNMTLPKNKNIIYVGRIEEEQKRISLLIKFWEKVSELPAYNDWNFILIGDGSYMEIAKKITSHLPRINFAGFQEPWDYYSESSIFAMTSAFEGWPVTLIEAQNYGCVPVAMDSFFALHDIIESGKNGFIVPNNDINTFTEKVCLLMDNAELREKMAKNAMNDCEKFDVQKIARKWENLFMEIL